MLLARSWWRRERRQPGDLPIQHQPLQVTLSSAHQAVLQALWIAKHVCTAHRKLACFPGSSPQHEPQLQTPASTGWIYHANCHAVHQPARLHGLVSRPHTFMLQACYALHAARLAARRQMADVPALQLYALNMPFPHLLSALAASRATSASQTPSSRAPQCACRATAAPPLRAARTAALRARTRC